MSEPKGNPMKPRRRKPSAQDMQTYEMFRFFHAGLLALVAAGASAQEQKARDETPSLTRAAEVGAGMFGLLMNDPELHTSIMLGRPHETIRILHEYPEMHEEMERRGLVRHI